MLFNATYHEELRVALVDGQKLINFDIETTSKAQRRGNVYKGVITRIEPSLEACFVDYGTEKQGFLPFKEVDIGYLPEMAAQIRDFSQLKEGVELIVQVEKDERGKKGAALTTFISLPGRYLVLMPNNSRSGGISRRIDGDERSELKDVLSSLTVPNGMSVIARTAALGRVQEELQWDLNYLLKLWEAIRSARSNQVGGFLIYQESNLVIRSIRDHFSPDIAEILIDKEDVYQQAQQFIANVMPGYVDRVKLYRDDVALFSRFQIEHQIETVYARTVILPSGGSIAIDPTEALTAIDVNSAKANKGADIEATALATNIEAAEEIARQLRLRDSGGLVVVDFIDMENMKNQREVENFFRQQLNLDRARVQMGRLSKFGLLELSRQRLKSSLDESITISCPRCCGTGSIRGIESVAVHVLRIVQEEVVKHGGHISAMHVQLPIDVATYLLNEKRDDVAALEGRSKIKIMLIPNGHLESPSYKIRKIGNANYDAVAGKLSYNLVEEFEDSYINRDAENKANVTKPEAVVKDFAPNQPAPMIAVAKPRSIFNTIVELLQKMFQSSKVAEQPEKVVKTRYQRNSSNDRAGRSSSNTNRTTNTNRSKPNSPSSTRPANPRVAQVKPVHQPKQVSQSSGVVREKKPADLNNESNAAQQAPISRQRAPQRNPAERRSEPGNYSERRVNNNPNREPKERPAYRERVPAMPKIVASEIKPSPAPVVKPAEPNFKVSETPIQKVAASQHNSAESVIRPTPKVALSPIVKPVEKIDLGTLEMVATNMDLLRQEQVSMVQSNNTTVKRHNELYKDRKTIVHDDTNYEQVETNKQL